MRRYLNRVTNEPVAILLIAVGMVLPTVVLAAADTFTLTPDVQLVGEVATVAAGHEDTLTDIARVYGLGYEEIVWANRSVDIWLPGEGTAVTLPKKFVLPGPAREGIVVNIAEYRLYHYYLQNGQQMVSTFPISIGRMDWSTPIGRWAVTAKQKDPTWYPPESIRKEHIEDGRGELAKAVPPGPDNPLGRYAMRLSASGYLIHGTNRPVGVGMQVTHGCIRMYPEDIEWLFPQIPVSTPVTIMNQPYKFGWSGNDLYLEVHPPLEDDRLTREREMTALTEQYVLVTRDRPARIDWQAVEEAYRRRDGIPVVVGAGLGAEQATTAL
ncbi:MAG: L,D-transpeptidase family protein [Gammaproteobacteria bacterium]|nr:L,D-transpeptidase family protein [Gammaproteobacteria bacterium]